MNRSRTGRKILLFILTVMTVVSLFSLNAFAEEDTAKIHYAYLSEYGDYSDILDMVGLDSRSGVQLSDYSSFKQRDKEESVFDVFFPAVVDTDGETATVPGLNEGSDVFFVTDFRCDVPVVLIYRPETGTGTRLAALRNSIVKEYAEQFLTEKKIQQFDSAEDCMKALENGKVDCVALTLQQAAMKVYSNEKYTGYKTLELEKKCTLAIVTKGRNGEQLAERINSHISAAGSSQLTDGAVNQYLNIVHPEKKLNVTMIVCICVGLALIAIIYTVYKQYKENKREQTAVINCLSSDFECVTLFDVKSNHESRYRISELFSKLIPGWSETDDYEQRMRLFAETLVVQEDRQRFLQGSEKEFITAKLKEASSFSLNYKINIGGEVQFFQTKYVHDEANRNSVIAGFHNVDNEVRKELELQARIRENAMVQRLSMQIVTTLVKVIDAKDRYTNGHSIRVATYAREIAKRTGMNEKRQQEIYYMGLLHDIGKIGIPDEVINKTGKLNDEEFAIIKQHPELGARILEGITEMPKLKVGAMYHHERYDGRGYPEGLSGKAITAEARILGVADAYDAMSSPRSFRDAFSQEKIVEEIRRGIGTQFDPEYARAMIEMIAEDTEFKMREKYGMEEETAE